MSCLADKLIKVFGKTSSHFCGIWSARCSRRRPIRFINVWMMKPKVVTGIRLRIFYVLNLMPFVLRIRTSIVRLCVESRKRRNIRGVSTWIHLRFRCGRSTYILGGKRSIQWTTISYHWFSSRLLLNRNLGYEESTKLGIM